ncbi:hypothetical protein [Geoalkalibacter halelectricus]|uniref:Lipoprotein n=1 Tax=Geoalkalibacter halelectricus TaxID=2847045 RepID=A0ABY5ZKU9_9BACT|nr:hypothetical protein [Geoalkalibacter halelectricus]MDO3376512.1 hypothetical protein [Geoalkalibacter halelectricus]UWZ79770.1 hypothetical protein L9S41_19130 [Geoalkalibacter halelectricus]
MKKLVAVLLAGLYLAGLLGCSAQGLKKAEENTRLAGATNPLGALIYLPVWAASTVAGAVSGSPPPLEGELLEQNQEQESAEGKKAAGRKASEIVAGAEETPLNE